MAGVIYNETGTGDRQALDFNSDCSGGTPRGFSWCEMIPPAGIQTGFRYPTLSQSYTVGLGVTNWRIIVHTRLHAPGGGADPRSILLGFVRRASEYVANPMPLMLKDEYGQQYSDCVLKKITPKEGILPVAPGGVGESWGKTWFVDFEFEQQKVAFE